MVTFSKRTISASGGGPVAVADLNGDGITDFIVADMDGCNVAVLIGIGDGNFRKQNIYFTGDPEQYEYAHSISVGDFNGDGAADLAVATINSNHVSVLLGNGDGSFQAQVNYVTGDGPNVVTVGDLNGDGKTDLVVGNSYNDISVLLGNGDGTFQPQTTYGAGRNPWSISVADVNGDGAVDLVVANTLDNSVSILRGNGDGSFRVQVTYAAGSKGTSEWAESVAIGDFNGDGKLDLVVANSWSNHISVLLGNGDGSYRPKVTYPSGTAPWSVSSPASVSVADFNGDGIADLAVANQFSYNVSVLLGNGDGTFQTQTTYEVGNGPRYLAVADFNGDGKVDLVVGNESGGKVSVLLNTSIFPRAIKGTLGDQKTLSEAPVRPFKDVIVMDYTSGAIQTLTIDLSASAGGFGGALAVESGARIDAAFEALGSGKYRLTGSAAEVTNALHALTFTPTPGAPGTQSTTTFSLKDESSLDATATLIDSKTTVINADPFTGQIAGVAYLDRNASKTQESDDRGLAGLEVKLFDQSGVTLKASTTTDASGHYSFAALADGTYKLSFHAPDGYKADPGALDRNGNLVIEAVVADGATSLLNEGFLEPRRGNSDLNGDHHSDILLQNANGACYVWQMGGGADGLAITASGFIGGYDGPGAKWQVKATGDFDGDGKSDLLLQYKDTGAVYVWEMGDNGKTIKAGGFVGGDDGPGAKWQVKGTGDFNGDGKSDILLQYADTGAVYVWRMGDNGLSIKGGGFAGGDDGPGAKWQVKGTGDFDGDGKSDILLQYADTGACYVWEMGTDGQTIKAGGFIGGFDGPGAKWQVKGTGDFNGDGKSDILLQYADTGAVYVWELDGLSIKAGGFVGGDDGPGAKWQVKSTGDFDGDGRSDILLQYADTGACYVWETGDTGLTIKAGGFVGGYGGPGADWHTMA